MDTILRFATSSPGTEWCQIAHSTGLHIVFFWLRYLNKVFSFKASLCQWFFGGVKEDDFLSWKPCIFHHFSMFTTPVGEQTISGISKMLPTRELRGDRRPSKWVVASCESKIIQSMPSAYFVHVHKLWPLSPVWLSRGVSCGFPAVPVLIWSQQFLHHAVLRCCCPRGGGMYQCF